MDRSVVWCGVVDFVSSLLSCLLWMAFVVAVVAVLFGSSSSSPPFFLPSFFLPSELVFSCLNYLPRYQAREMKEGKYGDRNTETQKDGQSARLTGRRTGRRTDRLDHLELPPPPRRERTG
ncbi:hypothetical protein B0T24DRAFT_623485 [Lasiosphaeria ovina]|uniref:Transmembrane protein n=1 Tax=Lasiosphaeria ovina TaxID=92902 RepID=A0AAE0KC95_9PEZI|nr:hypothetical protein B0T24DRAFT_623485 [Lasiosphaeria ovina]